MQECVLSIGQMDLVVLECLPGASGHRFRHNPLTDLDEAVPSSSIAWDRGRSCHHFASDLDYRPCSAIKVEMLLGKRFCVT